MGAAGEPAFQNGWSNFGAPYDGAGFYKDALGRVWLRGLIKGGTAGAVAAFTLPAGYRPSAQKFLPSVGGGNAAATLIVTPTGEVRVNSGTNTYIMLDSLSFRAAQ